ncbi:MAG: DUF3108 domain-containing protein [Alphaproteobacteria bacterium]|nr:DUF3108 domain-containing protein [Alphaproteobacteria bacterium]
MPRLAALLVLLLPGAVRAEPGSVTIRLTYEGYASGLHALSITSDLTLGSDGYRIAMSGHTAGMIGFLYHARWRTVSEGTWAGAGIAPRLYDNAGTFGGEPRHVEIAFHHGMPDLLVLDPRDDHEHEPAPVGLADPSIDSLALSALLIRQVANDGTCGGRLTTFDGRQIQIVTLQSRGPEMLAPTDRSSFRGAAERCDVNGQVIAGFERDDPARTRTILHDAMWLGPVVAGAPNLPVRMNATTRHLGHTTLYLTGATVIDGGTRTASKP